MKQMHNSIIEITQKENGLNDWNSIFNSVDVTDKFHQFVFVYACFVCMSYVSRLLSGFFGTRSGFF